MNDINLDNIPDGYLFNIKNGDLSLITGTGGVKEFIKTCRNNNNPDELTESMIRMTLDEELKSDTEFHPLSYFKKDE
jgi:hypothetical protein